MLLYMEVYMESTHKMATLESLLFSLLLFKALITPLLLDLYFLGIPISTFTTIVFALIKS